MRSYYIYNFGYRIGYKKKHFSDMFSTELTNVYFM